MCGIFGFETIEKEKEKVFFDSLKHRGPDNHKSVHINNWTFGFCRLAILDTSAKGDQPMVRNGDYLVFNGEIYNYLELKEKYLQNVKLTSSSDTEVLLELLTKCGLKILNELNGMFAFAWYSNRTKRLTLVRDRYGVKPLFWMKENSVLYFSSETSPLVKIQSKVELNKETIDTFLKETVTEDGEESYLKGIFRVMPGCFVEIENGDVINKQRWYEYSDFDFDKNIFKSHKKTVDFFEELLTSAISLRHRSDVPVAITLSGGLDSTTIYTLAKENFNSKAQPFTFSHSGRETDELKLASNLASKYHDKIVEIRTLKNASTNALKKILSFLEFPMWDYSAAAYWETYKSIRNNGYVVVIEGHGSDEILGGYPYMVQNAWKEEFCEGKFIKAYRLYKIYNKTVNSGLNERPSKQFNFFDFIMYGVKELGLKSFFTKRRGIFESQIRLAFDRNIIPVVLRTFDRLTMANSIESRSPFMDYRVVEFARALPMEYKVNELGNKAILREILIKHGNKEVGERKVKMGFAADSPAFFNNYLNRKSITEIIKRFNDRNYLSLKTKALAIMKKPKILWSDLDSAWKILSLQITKDIYKC
jgi:asparagine synthase (glutamine-hydrolysing)